MLLGKLDGLMQKNKIALILHPAHQDELHMYLRFKGKKWYPTSTRRTYSGENFSRTQKSETIIEKMDTLDNINTKKFFMAEKNLP